MNLNCRHVTIDDLTSEQIDIVKKYLYYEDYVYRDDKNYEFLGSQNFVWEHYHTWSAFMYMIYDIAKKFNPDAPSSYLHGITRMSQDAICKAVRGMK